MTPAMPWIIMGDFNSILSQQDKYNGEPKLLPDMVLLWSLLL
jgi:hypothetical protein